MSDNSSLISTRRLCLNAEADFCTGLWPSRLPYRAFVPLISLISFFRLERRSEMYLASIMVTIIRLIAARGRDPASRRECLTTVAHEPTIVIEQATSSYSFRFPELSQPI